MGQRYNAKGQLIKSNHEVVPIAPATYRCRGCGREFSRAGMARPYAESLDGARWDALVRARAMRHADNCKGKIPTKEDT